MPPIGHDERGKAMKLFVIKCGGSVLEKVPDSFYEDLIEVQKNGQYFPIIVHGGGPAISQLLSQLKIPSRFHNGLRVTTKEVLEVVEMVLNGSTNKKVVTQLIKAGGHAIGVSGIDGFLIQAEPIGAKEEIGLVGKVVKVNVELISHFVEQGMIPVISPIGMDQAGQHYNINADTVACALAHSFQAPLCYLTDVSGIMVETTGQKTVLHTVSKQQVEEMIASKVITGGMIPKVQAALDSLQNGVPEVVIVNGGESHVITRYLKGESVGTKILIGEEAASHV